MTDYAYIIKGRTSYSNIEWNVAVYLDEDQANEHKELATGAHDKMMKKIDELGRTEEAWKNATNIYDTVQYPKHRHTYYEVEEVVLVSNLEEYLK